MMTAGISRPARTLRVLLLNASLKVAEARPRRARKTAATALGRLVTAARTMAPVITPGMASGRRVRRRCVPWRRWPRGRRQARGRRQQRLAGRSWRGGWLRIVLVLPRRPPRRARIAAVRGSGRAERPEGWTADTYAYGASTARVSASAATGGIRPVAAAMAEGCDPQRHGALEDDDPAVQFDAPGDDGAQPDQRGQVEHVGAEDHAGADIVLAVGERGHRRGDFGGVGGERRDQARGALRTGQAVRRRRSSRATRTALAPRLSAAAATGSWCTISAVTNIAPTRLPGSPVFDHSPRGPASQVTIRPGRPEVDLQGGGRCA